MVKICTATTSRYSKISGVPRSVKAQMNTMVPPAKKSVRRSGESHGSTSSENLSAARGRIMDADFASETMNLSRAQILQQAGTAMVAQANQLPQQVLTLLR